MHRQLVHRRPGILWARSVLHRRDPPQPVARVTHVRRHHRHYRTRGGGHLYQGRFKSFPVQEDFHFLRLCRYVEANPLRAGLVPRAEDWPWSGLRARSERGKPFRLATWPVDRPRNWLAEVNEEHSEDDLKPLRISVNRGRP